MTIDPPEPLYERFRLAYPSGTVVHVYYGDDATLGEVRVTHPLALVKADEDSQVSVDEGRP